VAGRVHKTAPRQNLRKSRYAPFAKLCNTIFEALAKTEHLNVPNPDPQRPGAVKRSDGQTFKLPAPPSPLLPFLQVNDTNSIRAEHGDGFETERKPNIVTTSINLATSLGIKPEERAAYVFDGALAAPKKAIQGRRELLTVWELGTEGAEIQSWNRRTRCGQGTFSGC
jgi:hypothetical protein